MTCRAHPAVSGPAAGAAGASASVSTSKSLWHVVGVAVGAMRTGRWVAYRSGGVGAVGVGWAWEPRCAAVRDAKHLGMHSRHATPPRPRRGWPKFAVASTSGHQPPTFPSPRPAPHRATHSQRLVVHCDETIKPENLEAVLKDLPPRQTAPCVHCALRPGARGFATWWC